MKTLYKTAKTTQPFTVNFRGTTLTVPVGSTVSNRIAGGYDDEYHFWEDFEKDDSILAHDLAHYGLNVSVNCCESYEVDNRDINLYDDGSIVVVLGDGETFMSLDGARLLHIPDSADDSDGCDVYVKDHYHEGTEIFNLLPESTD